MILEQRRRSRALLSMLLVSALLPAGTLIAFAQAPARPAPTGTASQAATAPLAFDVVSIKTNKSGSMMSEIMLIEDGLTVTGMPAHMLLREALGVSNNQLLGEPGWVNGERFDIEAKVAPEDVPRLKDLKAADRWAMLLPVFEDRFGLKFHHETRDLTQYVLVVAKGGLKMKEAKPGDTYPNGFKGANGGNGAGMMRMQPGEVNGQAVPIANLVRLLSLQLGSAVIDKTGLTGRYDFDLKWTPDETQRAIMMKPPDRGQPEAGNPAPPSTTGPSLFTALDEQLGVKLEAHKEPSDVIVVDHIEQPSPN